MVYNVTSHSLHLVLQLKGFLFDKGYLFEMESTRLAQTVAPILISYYTQLFYSIYDQKTIFNRVTFLLLNLICNCSLHAICTQVYFQVALYTGTSCLARSIFQCDIPVCFCDFHGIIFTRRRLDEYVYFRKYLDYSEKMVTLFFLLEQQSDLCQDVV